MLDGDQVVDALRLSLKTSRYEVFDIDDTLTNVVRVIFDVLMSLKGFKDSVHLRLSQNLTGELFNNLVQVAKCNSILQFDELATKQLPLLLVHLVRYGVEEVYRGVLHDLLVKWTVSRSCVIKGVLPAARILAGLTLAILDVLAEKHSFLR